MGNKQPEYGLPSDRKRQKAKSGFSLLWLLCLAALALGSMAYGTQRVAEFYSWSPELGSPVFGPYYWPWEILNWYMLYGGQSQIITESINYAMILFTAPVMLAVFLHLAFFGRKPKGNADLHGSAQWAKYDEIKEMTLLEGQGVYVGGWVKRISDGEWLAAALRWFVLLLAGSVVFVLFAPFRVKKAQAFIDTSLKAPPPAKETQFYLRHDGPEHIMCFAPTRSGKGVGLILPTLFAWGESSLVLDIKGENHALTGGYLKSIGHTVLRFDPSDESGTGASYNPLEEVRLNTLKAIQDVQNITSIVVDPDGKGLDDHWSKAGFAFLSGVILHCLVMIRNKKDSTASMYDLINMMAAEEQSIQELLDEMIATDHDALLKEMFPRNLQGGEYIHRFIAGTAREMKNKAENEASGVVSTAIANLSLYRDPIVDINTSRSDFRITDLMNADKPVNLYFVVGPNDIKRLRPLIRLMLTLFVNRLTAKMEFKDGRSVKGYKHRLLLMLDEFSSLGKLACIEGAIAFMAGYGIKGYFIVQDVVQLNAAYGKDNGLLSNCHLRIAYAPNNIDTAKMLSEMVGKTTIVEKKVSISGSRSGRLGNASVSINETARPLLTPDECMRLPGPTKDAKGDVLDSGDMLIFMAGKSTIYGKQILYFRDPVFSARAMMLPPVQSDRLTNGVPVIQDDVSLSEAEVASLKAKQEALIESTMRYFEEEDEAA